MKSFCKVNNLQNEANAASYLFQLVIAKSKMLRGGDAVLGQHSVKNRDWRICYDVFWE